MKQDEDEKTKELKQGCGSAFETDDPHSDRADDRQSKIGRGASGGNQHVFAFPVPVEIVRIDRDRFCPPDQGQSSEHRDQRKQHGADRIDVNDRIQGDAPQLPRGGVTQHVCGQRVSGFVKCEGQQQDDEADENCLKIDHGGLSLT